MLTILAFLVAVLRAQYASAAGAVCDGQALGRVPTLKGRWVCTQYPEQPFCMACKDDHVV